MGACAGKQSKEVAPANKESKNGPRPQTISPSIGKNSFTKQYLKAPQSSERTSGTSSPIQHVLTNGKSHVLAQRGDVQIGGLGEVVTVGNVTSAPPLPPKTLLPSSTTSSGGDMDAASYVATHDYMARTPQDLSFRAGEIIRVLSKRKTQWWYGENCDGKAGYLPSSFLAALDSVHRHAWYHGCIERLKAINMLMGQSPGAFLIRESETNSGEYSLSVRDHSSVKHYRIKSTPRGDVFISPELVFSNLETLVSCYKTDSNGLCCRLGVPCPKAEATTLDLDHNTADNWEVDRASVVLERPLGNGEFGEVWYARWRGLTPVAVKMLKPGTTNQTEFLKEAAVMKRLQHDKLIRLYAVVTVSEPMAMITQYMEKGSLLDLLRTGFNIMPRLADMAGQVAEGMAYLEDNNFIHRDLAARNVLVDANYTCKVADFGLARLVKSVYENREGVYNAQSGAKFPVKWTAPEACLFNTYSIKSDVWSFGILLYEMATNGAMPYSSMTNAEVVDNVIKGYRLPRPDKCPLPIYQMMMDCWAQEPHDRPLFDTLYLRLCDMQYEAHRYTETASALLDG